ncbi:MAG: PIN domain-containing protein [Burkholderiaceae bacterium]|jgi:predicted nucleic acid-binding protein|nr:PIN domain-containing protein [Burkholderiaceae bacterium]
MVSSLITLDTNVCLDLFLFDDPVSRPLRDMLEEKTLRATTCPDCRDEWLRVVCRPSLPFNSSRREKGMSDFDRLISCHPHPKRANPLLPVCKDGDDQKFLELTFSAGAACLITWDKALLKLSRHTQRAASFRVMTPRQFIQIQNSTPQQIGFAGRSSLSRNASLP